MSNFFGDAVIAPEAIYKEIDMAWIIDKETVKNNVIKLIKAFESMEENPRSTTKSIVGNELWEMRFNHDISFTTEKEFNIKMNNYALELSEKLSQKIPEALGDLLENVKINISFDTYEGSFIIIFDKELKKFDTSKIITKQDFVSTAIARKRENNVE